MQKIKFRCLWNKSNDIVNNQYCDICLGDQIEDSDKLVFCDGCNYATHQSCYGNELVDSPDILEQCDEWYC